MNFSVQKRKVKIIFDQEDLKYRPIAKIDKRRLQQVLLNLLSNACKFQTEGFIHVKASISDVVSETVNETDKPSAMTGNELLLKVSVCDEGIGIIPDKLSSIFEPFGQSSGTNQTAGNGVGLSICKRICEQLQGSITVISHIGVGSKFSFTMRAYKAAESELLGPNNSRKRKKSILQIIYEETSNNSP